MVEGISIRLFRHHYLTGGAQCVHRRLPVSGEHTQRLHHLHDVEGPRFLHQRPRIEGIVMEQSTFDTVFGMSCQGLKTACKFK